MDNSFNDMDYLAMFVASQSVSSRMLAQERPSASNPVPAVWLPASTLLHTRGWDRHGTIRQKSIHDQTVCSLALDQLSFTGQPNATLQGLPVFSAPSLRENGSRQLVPMIHFQGTCKSAVVHQLYMEHYASAFAQSPWALTADEQRRHQSWWNALLPSYDWRRARA